MNIVTGLLSAVSPKPDGDFVDRLNYCITTVSLVVTASFISTWSFVGSPIQCWFPAYYKGWWQEYALDYCFVQNTYYVPMFEKTDMAQTWDIGQHMMPLPVNDTVKEKHQIGYYQWVPFILAGQALLFYLPIVIWRALYESAGFKVGAILETCTIAANMDDSTREKNMKTIASFLTQDLRRLNKGRIVTFFYLGLKLLFAINAIAQFVALKSILGVDDLGWGWTVTKDLFSGIEWDETGNFPRITLCDFTIRELGNMHQHTVQCVLMINMFNEKIFVAIWYWLCFMFAVSVTSFINWTIKLTIPTFGVSMINSYIHKIDPATARSLHKKNLLRQFIEKQLGPDGILIVRLIESNNGDLVTCALLETLWNDFKDKQAEFPPPYSEPLLLKNQKLDEDKL